MTRTSAVDREWLLGLARRAIVDHVNHVSYVGDAQGTPGALLSGPGATGESMRPAGAFVSLHAGRELRGCIGHIEADEPLPDVVARCAARACSADPRFPPVAAHELATIDIELSVLGPL